MHSTVVQRRVIINIEIVCGATVKVDVDQNCAALGIGYIGLRDCVITTLSGVDLPNPFFAALDQCASRPGAPAASLLVACRNKAVQPSKEIVEMTNNWSILSF